ncbi:triphosphoribosyl-dephospho-CoA synthase [Salmonella enterica subsp. enterica serovar Weltevreden]|nr:triphosphoribosyl-dephospho-CoA synthase [Salmonella enterica subsp. enterica serovar Weltevreden]
MEKVFYHERQHGGGAGGEMSEEVMLRPLGMACENDMLQATNGEYPSRGDFRWPTGHAAIGHFSRRENRWSKIVSATRLLALVRYCCPRALSRKAGKTDKSETHFSVMACRARGRSGKRFRTRQNAGFAVFNRVVQEHDDTRHLALQTLLHLMAWNDDTNLNCHGELEGALLRAAAGTKIVVASRGCWLRGH